MALIHANPFGVEDGPFSTGLPRSYMGLLQSDPNYDFTTGMSQRARGMQKRFEYDQEHGSSFGPLPDPQWAGFFQALEDQGVDRVGQMAMSPGTAPTFDPSYQSSALGRNGVLRNAQGQATANVFVPNPSTHIGNDVSALEQKYTSNPQLRQAVLGSYGPNDLASVNALGRADMYHMPSAPMKAGDFSVKQTTTRNVKNPRARQRVVGQRGTSGSNQTERA